MQENKVTAYASYWLKCYERDYSTHDVELAPKVLLGEFKVITHICRVSRKVYVDHQNLRYTCTRKELNLRQQSLLEPFKGYGMHIQCHPL